MNNFKGFLERGKDTRIPEAFFKELLPFIDDLLELKLVLLILQVIQTKKGDGRFITESEMAKILSMTHLKSIEEGKSIKALLISLEKRGIIIAVVQNNKDKEPQRISWVLNDFEGRNFVEQSLVESDSFQDNSTEKKIKVVTRNEKNIFSLYEEVIGSIPGSQIADELIEVEKIYSDQWIRDAFKEAASQNVRKWAYVRAILGRWNTEGRLKKDGKIERSYTENRYHSGKYGKIVRSK